MRAGFYMLDRPVLTRGRRAPIVAAAVLWRSQNE
jgi:hypothetical protein